MIEILGNDGFTVNYKCTCGIKGKCMLKPPETGDVIISNITCPLCGATERVKIVRYEKDKENTLASKEITWTCVIYNEITDYELKENLDA